MIARTLFGVSVSLGVYTYIGYPLAMWTLARIRTTRREAQAAGSLPHVSLIIAAYNEQEVIEDKIRNSLALDYPPDKLEILIGSDGSTDRTVEITSSLVSDPRVRIHAFPRRGKIWVLNDLVNAARGDILVFSDANTICDSDALGALIPHFD